MGTKYLELDYIIIKRMAIEGARGDPCQDFVTVIYNFQPVSTSYSCLVLIPLLSRWRATSAHGAKGKLRIYGHSSAEAT